MITISGMRSLSFGSARNAVATFDIGPTGTRTIGSVATRPYRALARSDDSASPEDVIVGSERMHELEDVLVDLEPVHQKALALAAMGYDAHTIARTIGRTDGATRTMLCRVRAKVRAQVAASAQPIAS
jgi:DNA-directed RNA polymerase specialized sigma24 family protein